MYGNVLIISDTPRRIYPWLRRTISKYNISTVMHLGDLADDIKLEVAPHKRWLYEGALRELKRILGGNRLIIVAGNHDDREIITNILGIHPLAEGTRVHINGLDLILFHHPPSTLPKPTEDLILHGHTPQKIPSPKVLNVLLNPYIILSDGRLIKIKYPEGTNRERKLRMRGG